MKRRDFIAGVAAAAAFSPRTAHAQEKIRRVGMITGAAGPDDEDAPQRNAAFRQGLQQGGWVEGRNVQIVSRHPRGNPEAMRKAIAELIAVSPDVMVVSGTASMAPLLAAVRTLPIVFINVADPVGAGFVESLAQPGGNATGFMQFEYSLSGKWVELIKQLAPGTTRAAILRDPTITSGIGQFAVIQSVAPSARIEVTPIDVRDAGGMERRLAAFARQPHGAMIATASASVVAQRDLVIALAARYRLPAIYHRRAFPAAGGLMSYGPNLFEQFRQAGGYVGRILKGEKPADLPVQAPTKYELVINLKTAKALGLTVPPSLLAIADEVVE